VSADLALGDARVQVVVRDGCHLCEQACRVVGQVCDQAGVDWDAVDIDAVDIALRRRWTDHVPVVVVDGVVRETLQVDAARLRSMLAA
jgi:hypothetical protein